MYPSVLHPLIYFYWYLLADFDPLISMFLLGGNKHFFFMRKKLHSLFPYMFVVWIYFNLLHWRCAIDYFSCSNSLHPFLRRSVCTPSAKWEHVLSGCGEIDVSDMILTPWTSNLVGKRKAEDSQWQSSIGRATGGPTRRRRNPDLPGGPRALQQD